MYSSGMVSDHCCLINVVLTLPLMIPAMTLHSDPVSDNSGSNKCDPDKSGHDRCGSNKCSFDVVPDMVSDNPGCDKHRSELI